ncbi:CDP-diacylglycerol diphosphatase [Mycobacterium antarcticum]|uniref:CDP-diacylglycerol diphosphatase n=1 Tax=Mycolicibacterium sp. TUM20984 TaxID=3023368 RepID=UPI00238468FA|nr:CDP-diacylglycerol diphosphatase [Mycolicibacterium sp. TUM20984]GLP81232.1 CDP-diacylglycerol diphosphatase [Mycolicibacterium sp. TUM20984]
MRGVAALGLAVVVALGGPGIGRAAADASALWRIVDGQCVPNQVAHGNPAPCAEVDLDAGSAVLKDLVGATQYLLIPTERSSGIEDPAILAPDAPNYFAAAWRARSFVDERAGVTLPRDWVSLAINSAFARSQDQLHIHVDCLSPDVHDALAAHAAAVGPAWAPFPVPLAGHRYDAVQVGGEDLDVDPFDLLADGVPGARDDMAARTLVVVGTVAADGRPGFVILTDRADPAAGDLAEGEELQDHDSCPRLAAVAPGK